MLSRIEQQLQSLSRAEQRVAGWVLAHPGQTVNSSVSDVALAAGTSEPTVVRFCRSVGLSGYRELKIRLTESLSRPVSYLHRDVNPDDSLGDAVTKVMDRSIKEMVDTRARISDLPFAQAVPCMAGARQLVFAGLGASGDVARDACQKFFRLGIPCTVASDGPMILQISAIADPRDVFLITSHSGRWPDIVRGARMARGRGATVIALTEPGSDLAKAASLVFACQSPEDTNIYTPMSSRLAQLVLMDALNVALALHLGPTADSSLRAAKAALLQRPVSLL